MKARTNFTLIEIIKSKKLGSAFYAQCPQHPMNVLRLSCKTCQIELCEECVASHSGHEFGRIKFSIGKLEEALKEAKQSIREN